MTLGLTEAGHRYLVPLPNVFLGLQIEPVAIESIRSAKLRFEITRLATVLAHEPFCFLGNTRAIGVAVLAFGFDAMRLVLLRDREERAMLRFIHVHCDHSPLDGLIE